MNDDRNRQATIGMHRDEAQVGASDEGMITVVSGSSVSDTISGLEAAITSAGMQVFARIDHSGMAEAAGLELRPTELLIFGNPRGGTPLMQDQQTAAIDLPLKILIWEGADGAVRVTYNDTAWLARRHGLGAGSDKAIATITAALAALVAVVSRPGTQD